MASSGDGLPPGTGSVSRLPRDAAEVEEEGNSILRPIAGATLIALSGLASRLLGLLRDRLFAHQFGAGEVLDAYFAAYRIPDILYNLLVIGALSAAFLPVVSRYLAPGGEGKAEAFRMTNALLTVTVLLLSATAIVVWLLAPVLVPILVPGFSNGEVTLAIGFTRIMLLQPILLGVSSILGSVLLAFHRFLAYAAAPVLYNIGIILGVVFLVPVLGVSGLAWGVVLGAVLHLLVQVLASARLGFLPRPALGWQNAGVRDVRYLFVPRVISLIARQASDIVVTVLGSRAFAGAITAYLLAANLQAVPIGLIGIPLAVAAFPFLSAAAAARNVRDFTSVLVRTTRLTLFLTLPASVFLLLLRAQVVRVILGTGAFGWDDTVNTFTVLGILALAVVSESLIPLLARAFFALHDTKTPMLVSLASILLNVAGAVLLLPRLGLAGIAWAFTASSLLHLLLLLTVLHHRLGGMEDRSLLSSASRAAIATVVAALVIQGPAVVLVRLGMLSPAWPDSLVILLTGLKGIIASLVDMRTFLGVATQLLGSLFGGALVFGGVSLFLRSPELRMFQAAWHARYARTGKGS